MKKETIEPNELFAKMDRLAKHLEALRISDYLELLEKPRKLIVANFVAGIARGVGFAVGTSLIFAIIVEILRRIVLINIPYIGEYLVEIIRFIELKK